MLGSACFSSNLTLVNRDPHVMPVSVSIGLSRIVQAKDRDRDADGAEWNFTRCLNTS